MWNPPGGKLKMNIGESPFECAIREGFEETGLKLSEEDLFLLVMYLKKVMKIPVTG